MVQKITVLGSTGSIGSSTLDVIRRHPGRYQVVALCAHSQVDRLFAQCLEFKPRYAVVRDPGFADVLRDRLQAHSCPTHVESGPEAIVRMADLPDVDIVLAAIVGAAGLPATLAAAVAGKRILLANKEALVMAGPVFMNSVRRHRATLLPIDSEHNAIFQSLPAGYSGEPREYGVERILLTASGGPFRNTPREALENVTPDEACAHPNWSMGRKISIDSATMMNKGLEMIEAHWLFGVPANKIQIVVHPQSIVHSLVQYLDGSVLAELGNPDMRTPIAHALAYPERISAGVEPLDLFAIGSLQFERPDFDRFPCLKLAYRALDAGQSCPAALNAANEVAVAAFMERKIGFTQISSIIAETLDTVPVVPLGSLEDVLFADSAARQCASEIVGRLRR